MRHDLRDSGESTTADPEAPAYALRDLAADAAALTGALGGGPAHLARVGVGGMIANQMGMVSSELNDKPRWRERPKGERWSSTAAAIRSSPSRRAR